MGTLKDRLLVKKSALTRFGKFHILATSRWIHVDGSALGGFAVRKPPRTAKRLAAGMEAGGALRIYEKVSGKTALYTNITIAWWKRLKPCRS
jgi:hypothetical protein